MIILTNLMRKTRNYCLQRHTLKCKENEILLSILTLSSFAWDVLWRITYMWCNVNENFLLGVNVITFINLMEMFCIFFLSSLIISFRLVKVFELSYLELQNHHSIWCLHFLIVSRSNSVGILYMFLPVAYKSTRVR